MDGHKDVENRRWIAPSAIGRRLLIHAGASLESLYHVDSDELRGYGPLDETLGAIIGAVTVSDIVERHESEWAYAGFWHWTLTNAVRFNKPVFCKGSRGLWIPEPRTVRALGKAARS